MTLESKAAWRVDVTNKDDQMMSKEFDTEADADTYIASMEAKEQWGKDVHESRSCLKGFTTQRDVVALEETYTLYMCLKEYTTNKTDITAARELEDQKKEIAEDMSFGKSLYVDIRQLNAGKTMAERNAMRSRFSDLRDALLDGDICSARASIAAIGDSDADVTVAQRDAVLAAIDAYKTCL